MCFICREREAVLVAINMCCKCKLAWQRFRRSPAAEDDLAMERWIARRAYRFGQESARRKLAPW